MSLMFNKILLLIFGLNYILLTNTISLAAHKRQEIQPFTNLTTFLKLMFCDIFAGTFVAKNAFYLLNLLSKFFAYVISSAKSIAIATAIISAAYAINGYIKRQKLINPDYSVTGDIVDLVNYVISIKPMKYYTDAIDYLSTSTAGLKDTTKLAFENIKGAIDAIPELQQNILDVVKSANTMIQTFKTFTATVAAWSPFRRPAAPPASTTPVVT